MSMTPEGFINEAQGYYGRYSAGQRKWVRRWLEPQSEKRIPYIWAEVLKAHSPSLKMPPGVSELNNALMIVSKERYAELSSYNPLQIEEIVDPAAGESALDRLKEMVAKLARKKSRRPRQNWAKEVRR